jgi:hypothetical protein
VAVVLSQAPDDVVEVAVFQPQRLEAFLESLWIVHDGFQSPARLSRPPAAFFE